MLLETKSHGVIFETVAGGIEKSWRQQKFLMGPFLKREINVQ